jgi:hypothetical protein
MVFREVVSVVVDTFVPIDLELFVGGFVAEPIPSHIPGFGTSLFDVCMHKTISR